MTDRHDSDWESLLDALARKLAALERDGVGWLSIASDPSQAGLLEEARARAAAQPTAASARGARSPAAPRPGAPPTAAPFPPAPLPGARPPAAAPPGASPARPDPAGAGQAGVAGGEQRGRHPPPAGARPGSGAAPGPPAPPASTLREAAPPGEAEPATPQHPSEIATLESLRFQYRECRRCKLAGGRNRLVFGVGRDRPRLMFVGEGPGAEEDQQGLPFVGRAGALLTGLIEAAGLTREDVYITNVVKCRPPGNRNPEPDEIAACRPILQRQIELLAPRLIVALGNVPLKVFKPSAAGITRERGTVFPYGEIPVLPTFHPSYLLRNPAALTQCWSDFRAAVALAYGGGGPAEAR